MDDDQVVITEIQVGAGALKFDLPSSIYVLPTLSVQFKCLLRIQFLPFGGLRNQLFEVYKN